MTQSSDDLVADEVLALEERPEDRLDPRFRDLEAPAEDAAEQAIPANPADHFPALRTGDRDVNEYDAIEQERIVELDDDYR